MRALALSATLLGCPTGPGDSDGPATDGVVDNPIPEGQAGTTTLPASGSPPSAPGIAISPVTPVAGGVFGVSIVEPSVDPDGDEVSYRYAWTIDGVVSEVTSAEVSGIATEDLQVWEVVVTPADGRFDGASARAAVTIGNAAPSAFAVRIEPENPSDGEDLSVVIDPAPVDPEGDPVTTTISWYDDDAYMPDLAGLTDVDGKWVSDEETFRVVVSVTDGFHPEQFAEASVLVRYTCDNPPPYNNGETTLSDASGYKGLAFDAAGYLVGYDGRGSLMQSAYDGTQQVLTPGVGSVQQIDRLHDGDLVYGDSSSGTLVRVYSTGATEVIAADANGVYGVTVGPDGKVWAVTGRGIIRVDPDTGESEVVVEPTRGYSMHSVAFNLDSTVLFIGVIGTSNIYQVSLDGNLDPTGSVSTYASGVGGGYHDGIDLDECGNLYVADYSSSGLYRVETDGTVTPFAVSSSTQYGHGVTWGEDSAGFNPKALYQPQPYNSNTVREVVIGFAGGDTVRTWNGVAVPY